MYTDFSNTWRKNILAGGHCLSPCTYKRCCNVFQKWQVKFWWSSWKCQKHQNFVLYGILKMTSTVDTDDLKFWLLISPWSAWTSSENFGDSWPVCQKIYCQQFISHLICCAKQPICQCFCAKSSNPAVLCVMWYQCWYLTLITLLYHVLIVLV